MKEIEKPKINFYFSQSDEFYLENDLFIIVNKASKEKYYLNKYGMQHRLDGPAKIFFNYQKQQYYKYYFINGIYLSNSQFAEDTNHLYCKSCYKFCNQKCF